MARHNSFIPIPTQIRLINDNNESTGGKLFRRRRESTLSCKSKSECERSRRSSIMSLFSTDDAASNPTFQDEKHLKLFESGEFQAYLKEHNILTTGTATLQVIFQQFLHDRNVVERRKSTNEKVKAAAPVQRRKSFGDGLLSIAGRFTRSTIPGPKRRSTTTSNGSEESHSGSENLLDDSIWSIDDSYRRDYMSVIRGDIESIFQQPDPEEVGIEEQVNDDVEEESMLKSFFRSRRSSGEMLASIDASYRNRRDSIFYASSFYSDPQSLPSIKNAAHVRQSPSIGEGSYKVEKEVRAGVRTTGDSNVYLEDDTQVGDDKSNNGEVEFFSLSRRRSTSDEGPLRIRRSSLVSRASESSSQLQKCLNEINADTLLGDDDQTVASENDDSVGTISSCASDQGLLWNSTNAYDTFDLRSKFAELHYHPRKRCPLSTSHKSSGNLAIGGGQLQDHFLASRESLLVELREEVKSTLNMILGNDC